MQRLSDSFGRSFEYLRLSVTESCNFRCSYCLPNGSSGDRAERLSLDEIARLTSGFAALGIRKVRLTGGEPTLRSDIVEIVRAVARTPGIETVALTTNGYRLASLAGPLHEAGLRRVNVSVDSLDRARFAEISGQDCLPKVMEGIERALACGFERVKVNTVLLRGLNDVELEGFLAWTRERPISVRFIELMRTGDNGAYFEKHHVSAGEIQLRLQSQGWKRAERGLTDGPAFEYRHPEFRGSIGLIAPYEKDFCLSCNRLRVTSQGRLRLCLFGRQDFDLRPLLREDSPAQLLQETVCRLIGIKPEAHLLHEGNFGNAQNLARIGG